jgi:hypothetical protein
LSATPTAKLQFLNDTGNDLLQIVAPGLGLVFGINAFGGLQTTPQLIPANAAINAHQSGLYVITKGSAAALTIVAPTAGNDDGVEIAIITNTSFAHTVTAPAGTFVVGGSALNTVLTFTAANGAGTSLYLTAYAGKWIVTTGGYGVITVS